MRFGYKQLGKPTPESINNWFDAGAFVSGLLISAVNDPKAVFIGPVTASIISWILGILVAFFLGGKRFFGVRTVAGQKIDVEDVNVMEEPQNKKTA